MLLENCGKIAVLLCETCFDGRGQESDPAIMDYAVTIESHGVCSRAVSYQKNGWRTILAMFSMAIFGDFLAHFCGFINQGDTD